MIVRRGNDRGAVLVIVAVFAIVAVVMLAAVVDLGGLRQEKKEVTLSTDAAALAAAAVADTEDVDLVSAVLGSGVDCASVSQTTFGNGDPSESLQTLVDDYLSRNGQSVRLTCLVYRTGFKQGYVVVSANESVRYAFGPAVGQAEGAVRGASVAAIDVDPGGGLRPIGICGSTVSLKVVDRTSFVEFSLSGLASLTGSGGYKTDAAGYIVPTSGGAPTEIDGRFAIEFVKGGSCKGAGGPAGSGNFGKLAFGGNTSEDCDNTGYFCFDLREGYYDPVSNPTRGDTGNNWSSSKTETSLTQLLSEGKFWAPIFSTVTKSGNNTSATLTHFVQVELIGYCVGGSATGSGGTGTPCEFSETGREPDKTTYFDFRVSRIVPYVVTGPPLTDDAELKPPRLCAVSDSGAEVTKGCPSVSP
jgi:hypothetical protein